MKRKFIAIALSAAAAASLPGPSTAETIFKCGASYSQSPCQGATTLEIDTSRRDAAAVRASEIA